MTTLAASPIDPNQLDLLTAIADNETPLGSLHRDDFRAACWQDASAHGGWVHPSRVSLILHNRFGEVSPRWFSAQWAPACGPKGFLDKTTVEAPIDARLSKGNGGKTVKLRKWRVAS